MKKILSAFLVIVSIMATALLVLAISGWRKNDMQSLFFGLLILVIPMILKLMGFDFAAWFSIYPLYAWMGL